MHVRALTLAGLVGLAACTAEVGPTDDTDEHVVRVGCVSIEEAWSVTLEGTGVVDPALYPGVMLRSECDVDVQIADIELLRLTAGYALADTAPLTLPPGTELDIGIGFQTEEPGVYQDELSIRLPEGEVVVPLTVEVIGTDWGLQASPTTLVRTCPTPVQVTTAPQSWPVTVLEVSANLDGVDLGWEVPTPTTIQPGRTFGFGDTLTLHEPATLTIGLYGGLRRGLSWDFPLSLDASAERAQSFALWADGRPLDVLITVDRRMDGYDATAVQVGLQGLLTRLHGLGADVRAVGLLRDSGCPLSAGAVGSGDAAEDARLLAAQLDVRFDRVGSTGIEDRPWELVSVALDPANTRSGGCNAWRRDDAALLVVHVLGGDDASVSTPSEYLATLRARVPFSDHVAISSLAPGPPAGCGGTPGAARLEQVAADSEGVFRDACRSDISTSLGELAVLPGEENQLRLSERPYLPSLQVLVDGREVEAVLDGTRLTLPRSVDRFRDDIEVRYVAADACPEG